MSTEEAVVFGTSSRLVGIVTCPAPETRRETAVILFNAGLVHRVGPNRLYVRLARRLSDLGYTVLRFDHSGIGDSLPREDHADFQQSAVPEAADAMDWLAAHKQCPRFVLIGLCSGTLTAFRTAQADPRVTSLILLTALLQDPSSVPEEAVAEASNRRIARSYLTERAVRSGWRKLLTGRFEPQRVWRVVRRVFRSRGARAVEPGVADVLSQLQALLTRGVSLLFIYAEPTTLLEYFRMTIGPRLGRLRRHGIVELSILKRADHTFTELHNQDRVLDLVTAWMARRCS